MMLLPLLDPAGSKERSCRRLKRRLYRSKGPNFLWHVDGNDKLKPYGITIHGCIDGYSRRIMWMKCGYTNNNPRVIAQHYIDTVRYVQGVPSLMRVDRGTENSIIAFVQPTLRSQHSDDLSGENSFRYGRSSSNQRIEAWWGFLRARMTDWWITFFRDLRMHGDFDDSLPHHLEAVRFCFGPIIQKEIDILVHEWNYHRIRESRNTETPGGIPEVLYFLPEMNGAEDHKFSVDLDLLDYAETNYGFPNSCEAHFCQSEEFAAYGTKVLEDYSLHHPVSWQEALQLYFLLLNDIDSM